MDNVIGCQTYNTGWWKSDKEPAEGSMVQKYGMGIKKKKPLNIGFLRVNTACYATGCIFLFCLLFFFGILCYNNIEQMFYIQKQQLYMKLR